MRPTARLVALFVAAAALVACDDSTAPSERLAVVILGSSFERDDEGIAQVPYEILNVGDEPLSVSSCGDWPTAALDRWANGRWEPHSGGVCVQDAIFAPVELDPGESFEGTRPVDAAGRFRMRFGVADVGGEVDWGAASAAFDVE